MLISVFKSNRSEVPGRRYQRLRRQFPSIRRSFKTWKFLPTKGFGHSFNTCEGEMDQGSIINLYDSKVASES